MNFFETRLEGGSIRGKGIDIPLPDRFKDHVKPGVDLMLGVRPEHLHEATAADTAGTVEAEVEVLEPLGADVHALGTVHAQPMTARLDPDTEVKVGDRIRLGVELDMIHLFDKGTGKTVLA